MFILDLRSEGCENFLKWLNFDEIIVIFQPRILNFLKWLNFEIIVISFY